jgi:hypothetical protein
VHHSDVQSDKKKGVISDKITHFDNSNDDFCDNVITYHMPRDNVTTWCDNVIT